MSARRSLRNRVAVTLAVFGAVVSMILAIAIYLASHDLEQRLIDDTLNAELDDLVERRKRNPESLPERTATIRAYVVTPDGSVGHVPREVVALGTGQHQLHSTAHPTGQRCARSVHSVTWCCTTSVRCGVASADSSCCWPVASC